MTTFFFKLGTNYRCPAVQHNMSHGHTGRAAAALKMVVVGVMAACATPGAPGRSLGLRGGGGPAGAGRAEVGLQALAVAVQAEAARIKREAGQVKDSGDAWMKAWIQSCADVLAEERCAAAARTGAAVDALQMRAETLAAMQANYKRFKARLKADKGDSKVAPRGSFLHVPAAPATFWPRCERRQTRTGRALAHVSTVEGPCCGLSLSARRARAGCLALQHAIPHKCVRQDARLAAP